MNRILIAIALSAQLAAPLVLADTLLVKRSEQANGAAFPKRGATKSQVSAQYGAPSTKHGAVGKPPISRWDYPAFSVYFEYDHVIDAVVKQASTTEMGVKPLARPSDAR